MDLLFITPGSCPRKLATPKKYRHCLPKLRKPLQSPLPSLTPLSPDFFDCLTLLFSFMKAQSSRIVVLASFHSDIFLKYLMSHGGMLQNSSSILVAVLALCLCGGALACGDTICHTYGDEPRFDDSDRPPNAVVLGRATWTVMHTTAAYLNDKGPLTDVEVKSIKTLFMSMPIHYPGKGQLLIQKIFADDTVKKELDGIKTKEDAQLFIWKVHNALTALVHPSRTPFPENLGLHVSQFRVANPEDGDVQYDIAGASDVQKNLILKALKTRWVAAGGLENKRWTKRDFLNLPPDRTMLGRAFWTVSSKNPSLPTYPTPYSPPPPAPLCPCPLPSPFRSVPNKMAHVAKDVIISCMCTLVYCPSAACTDIATGDIKNLETLMTDEKPLALPPFISTCTQSASICPTTSRRSRSKTSKAFLT